MTPPRHDVTVGVGAGTFHFRRRLVAALFRWSYRRANGWTSWEVLDDAERARSVKLKHRPMKRTWRLGRWQLTRWQR